MLGGIFQLSVTCQSRFFTFEQAEKAIRHISEQIFHSIRHIWDKSRRFTSGFFSLSAISFPKSAVLLRIFQVTCYTFFKIIVFQLDFSGYLSYLLVKSRDFARKTINNFSKLSVICSERRFCMKRKLRVYEGSGWNRKEVPEIRLQGKWLEALGFTIGSRIQVECSDSRLVITLDGNTGKREAKT